MSRVSYQQQPPRSGSSGFSIVELMIGLTIGLLVLLIIMQVFSVYEDQKRTTTSTSDAQTNGNIALALIKRDAQMAGFGLLPMDPASTMATNIAYRCDPSPTYDHDNDALTPAIDVLFPLVITDDAGPDGSDSITIRYGDPQGGGVPVEVLSVTGLDIGVETNLGCRDNDTVLAVQGTACTMTRVNDGDLAVETTSITVENAAGITLGTALACMGQWQQRIYSVNNNAQLALNDMPNTTGIVNIQAQYGISNVGNSNQITQWVDASGIWAAPTVANRNRIKAVRVAVVARDGKRDTNVVTATCSSLTAPDPTGLCTWAGSAGSPAPAIDLSALADWDHYRYRVFETIIPLRNMVWSRGVL